MGLGRRDDEGEGETAKDRRRAHGQLAFSIDLFYHRNIMAAPKSILEQITKTDFLLFNKEDVEAFIKREAEVLDEAELSQLFEDIYAFNAYLDRTEHYESIEKVPFWQYSVCLEWVESHFLSGTVFDLSLKNARRFLGSLRAYYDFLVSQGKLVDSSHLDKAIKTICGGKRLNLVRDIPYTGEENYTVIYFGGKEVSFDIADYWLLILHATLFDGNWNRLLEAAFGVGAERVQKVKGLQAKMAEAGYSGLRDILYGDVTKADADPAMAWFHSK
jgi:hypothetical protein